MKFIHRKYMLTQTLSISILSIYICISICQQTNKKIIIISSFIIIIIICAVIRLQQETGLATFLVAMVQCCWCIQSQHFLVEIGERCTRECSGRGNQVGIGVVVLIWAANCSC